MFRAPVVRSALRTIAAKPAQQQQAFALARSFSFTPRVASEHHEPILTGPGGKSGGVPTDLEQATGLERFELLSKLEGTDPFSMEPLKVERMGTPADPIKVFSLDPTRIIGCTGYPVDSHDTLYIEAHKDKPARCPECGCTYSVDFQGIEDHHH